MIRGWGLVLIAENINHGIDKSLIQVFVMVFENWLSCLRNFINYWNLFCSEENSVCPCNHLVEVIWGQTRGGLGVNQFQSLELINRNISSRQRSLSSIPETGSDFTLWRPAEWRVLVMWQSRSNPWNHL